MDTLKIALDIPNKILAGVLDGAGSRYWVIELTFDEFPVRDGMETCWEALLGEAITHVTVVEATDHDGIQQHGSTYRVTKQRLAEAVQIIATKYPRHLGAVVGGYESNLADQGTGDVLLQCAVFGERKHN